MPPCEVVDSHALLASAETLLHIEPVELRSDNPLSETDTDDDSDSMSNEDEEVTNLTKPAQMTRLAQRMTLEVSIYVYCL